MIAPLPRLLWLPALTGCLYVVPTYAPSPNRAPQVVRPEAPLADIPLLLDRDLRLTVVARDLEGDPLDFVWIVPVDVPHDWTTSTQGDLWYSVLDIEASPSLDGRRIECVVTDGDLERAITWLVESP